MTVAVAGVHAADALANVVAIAAVVVADSVCSSCVFYT